MSIADEIERLRVVVRHRPDMVTPRERRMIDLYSTHSLQQIGDIMGCHLETVRQVLKRRGVELRPPHKNIWPHSGHTRGMTWRKRSSHKNDCSANKSCARYPQD